MVNTMAAAAASAALQSFDEDAWDDLLNYIEERRVIPIIGPDLLRVQTDTELGTCGLEFLDLRNRANAHAVISFLLARPAVDHGVERARSTASLFWFSTTM